MAKLWKLVWCIKYCKVFSEKYDDEIRSLDQQIEEYVAIIDSKQDKTCCFEGSKLMQLRISKALCVKRLAKIETYNKSLYRLIVPFYQKNLKETPPPITYTGVWTKEDDIMD